MSQMHPTNHRNHRNQHERLRWYEALKSQTLRHRWPVLFCLLLALAFGTTACIGDSSQNPLGYPPIPSGAAPIAAPTQGGIAPTPIGADTPQGKAVKAGEKSGKPTTSGAGATGMPPVESGAGTASSAGASATPTPTANQMVMIGEDGSFSSTSLTINAGQAIMFVNNNRSPQTVTDDPHLAKDKSHVAMPSGAQPFDSGIMDSGQTYTEAFTVPGAYVIISLLGEAQGVACHITVR